MKPESHRDGPGSSMQEFKHPKPASRRPMAVYTTCTPRVHRVYTTLTGVHVVYTWCTRGVHSYRA